MFNHTLEKWRSRFTFLIVYTISFITLNYVTKNGASEKILVHKPSFLWTHWAVVTAVLVNAKFLKCLYQRVFSWRWMNYFVNTIKLERKYQGIFPHIFRSKQLPLISFTFIAVFYWSDESSFTILHSINTPSKTLLMFPILSKMKKTGEKRGY